MEADCFTSLLRRRTTALTPATVIMKFVKPITVLCLQWFFGFGLKQNGFSWEKNSSISCAKRKLLFF